MKQLGAAVENEEARPSFFAHGFNLYAGKRIAASDRRRREHAIRYMARPPILEGALSVASDGEVVLGHFDLKEWVSRVA